MASRPRGRPLTPRQHEVEALLAKGWTDDQIGAVLGIAGCTVRGHILSIRNKRGLPDRAQLVAWARAQLG